MSLAYPGQLRLPFTKLSSHGSLPSLSIKADYYWGLGKSMLAQLVNLLEITENGLSLSEISRSLSAQPSAVLCMIGVLVQKGKLIEVGPDGKCCTTCGLESECNLLAARGKRYVAARQAHSGPI